MYGDYKSGKESISTRIIHFIEDAWPSVYRTVNDILYGIINFIKDTLSSLWGGF